LYVGTGQIVIDHLNSYFFERRTAKIGKYPSSAIGKAANQIPKWVSSDPAALNDLRDGIAQ
jgi:hypothetical protein